MTEMMRRMRTMQQVVKRMRKRLLRLASSAHMRTTPIVETSMMSLATVEQYLLFSLLLNFSNSPTMKKNQTADGITKPDDDNGSERHNDQFHNFNLLCLSMSPSTGCFGMCSEQGFVDSADDDPTTQASSCEKRPQNLQATDMIHHILGVMARELGLCPEQRLAAQQQSSALTPKASVSEQQACVTNYHRE
ncbi:hypothetical protein EYF80_000895 [Liparis tanakae]|uniref:Uncharacterized protein n=1 Tax=Liparis tanakae TaxID=230148 RepID=A0A4Z2JGE9_9TELE|nr:hypothetical protein EYF80_000895 [Liparis tanakae]